MEGNGKKGFWELDLTQTGASLERRHANVVAPNWMAYGFVIYHLDPKRRERLAVLEGVTVYRVAPKESEILDPASLECPVADGDFLVGGRKRHLGKIGAALERTLSDLLNPVGQRQHPERFASLEGRPAQLSER